MDRLKDLPSNSFIGEAKYSIKAVMDDGDVSQSTKHMILANHAMQRAIVEELRQLRLDQMEQATPTSQQSREQGDG